MKVYKNFSLYISQLNVQCVQWVPCRRQTSEKECPVTFYCELDSIENAMHFLCTKNLKDFLVLRTSCEYVSSVKNKKKLNSCICQVWCYPCIYLWN